jgi:hypothetical protein
MDDLEKALGAAPREAQPPRDLWPAVESRIRRSVTGRWLRAAAAIVLFGAGMVTGMTVDRDTTDGVASPDTTMLHRLAALQQAGSEYAAAVARLRDPGTLNETLRAQGYEAALAVVSLTAREVTSALALDESDERTLVGHAEAVHAAASRRTSELLRQGGPR